MEKGNKTKTTRNKTVNYLPVDNALMICEPFFAQALCEEYFLEITGIGNLDKKVRVRDIYNNIFEIKLEKGRAGLAKFKFRGATYYVGVNNNAYYAFKSSCNSLIYAGQHIFMRTDIFPYYKLKELDKFKDRFLAF